jgi:O-antigen ligase
VVIASNEIDNGIFGSFLLYSLAPIVLMLLFINEIADVREMAYGFVVCSAAAAVASLYRFSVDPLEATRLIRGLGEVNYLTYSWGLAMAVLFGVGLLVASKWKASKAAFLAMAGICGIVILMTSARQSALGLGLALAYVSWVMARPGKRVATILVLSVVCAGLVAAIFLSTDIGGRFLIPKWSRVDESAYIRQQYWIEGWNAFLQHPGTGGGLTYLPFEDTAHNLIIDLLASQGIVGFVFLAGFATLSFNAIRSRHLRTIRAEGRIWKTILLSILLFTAIHGFASGSVMVEPEVIWGPFLLIQLAAIAERESLSKEKMPSSGLQPPQVLLRMRLSQKS